MKTHLLAYSLSVVLSVICIGIAPTAHAEPSSQSGVKTPSELSLGYMPSPKHHAPQSEVLAAAAGAPTIVYLNRCEGGCTVTKADADNPSQNMSFIPDFPVSNIPAWDKSDETWDEVVLCVRDLFSPFNIKIVDQKPDTPHHSAIVAGLSTDIFDTAITPDAANYGGIAGVYCDETVPFNISYVFAATVGDSPEEIRWVCDAVGQEVGHGFGIDHLLSCDDPMTYLPECGPKSFTDNDSVCGEFDPRVCSCTEGQTQNSYQSIVAHFGTNSPPTVSILSHQDGAQLEPGTIIDIDASDDVGITRVELHFRGVKVQSSTSAPFRFELPSSVSNGMGQLEVLAYDEREIAGTESISVEISGGDGSGENGNNGSARGEVVSGCNGSGQNSHSLCAFLLLALLGLLGRPKKNIRI